MNDELFLVGSFFTEFIKKKLWIFPSIYQTMEVFWACPPLIKVICKHCPIHSSSIVLLEPLQWCHMSVIASPFTDNSNICSTACVDYEQSKHRSPVLLALCERNPPVTGESTCHWWIPLTKGQWLISSSWYHSNSCLIQQCSIPSINTSQWSLRLTIHDITMKFTIDYPWHPITQ